MPVDRASVSKRTLHRTSLTLLLVLLAAGMQAQGRKTGNPEKELPPDITQLTGFGERAAWSPDDQRVAFMEKSFGDAFEIDLRTN